MKKFLMIPRQLSKIYFQMIINNNNIFKNRQLMTDTTSTSTFM
jgi:hypothetical protein